MNIRETKWCGGMKMCCLTPIVTHWSSFPAGNLTMNFEPVRSSVSLRGLNRHTTRIESSEGGALSLGSGPPPPAPSTAIVICIWLPLSHKTLDIHHNTPRIVSFNKGCCSECAQVGGSSLSSMSTPPTKAVRKGVRMIWMESRDTPCFVPCASTHSTSPFTKIEMKQNLGSSVTKRRKWQVARVDSQTSYPASIFKSPLKWWSDIPVRSKRWLMIRGPTEVVSQLWRLQWSLTKEYVEFQ